MKLTKDFFAEFGKLICSLTLVGGKLDPAEKELIVEMADDVFSTDPRIDDQTAPWKFMFSFPHNHSCHPDSRETFRQWMQVWDERGWKVSASESMKVIDLLFQIARAYGLSSRREQDMLDEFKAELHRRSAT